MASKVADGGWPFPRFDIAVDSNESGGYRPARLLDNGLVWAWVRGDAGRYGWGYGHLVAEKAPEPGRRQLGIATV